MLEKQAILIALKDKAFCNILEASLAGNNRHILKTADLEEVVSLSGKQVIHVALIESELLEGNNFELIDYLKSRNPLCSIIIMAGNGSIEEAVKVIRRGAYDYIIKPYKVDTLVEKIKHIDIGGVPEASAFLESFEGLVGHSVPMQKLYKIIAKVAQVDATVLITGESGTGKELVAQAIHRRSSRREKPFIPLNCGAIPEELLESELFGHEKGAFSGAIRTKIGRFELAHSGTIFLDEIGEMSGKLQVKLLRFLQERRFERVGGTKSIEVDARVIAATNKDLQKAVKEGLFREDLFYRLHVIPIHIVPLRERKEDIPILVEHFLENHCTKKSLERKTITPEVIECFRRYDWPGNVRELENLIERLVILSDGEEITVNELPERFLGRREDSLSSAAVKLPKEGIDLKSFLENIEKELIKQALDKTNGVKNQAAKLLGLNRTTLIEKMKKLKMNL